MKKIVLLMLLVLMVCLSACGGKKVEKLYDNLDNLISENGQFVTNSYGNKKEFALILNENVGLYLVDDYIEIRISKEKEYFPESGKKETIYSLYVYFSKCDDTIVGDITTYKDIFDIDVYENAFIEYIEKGKVSQSEECDTQMCAYIEECLNELNQLLDEQYQISIK